MSALESYTLCEHVGPVHTVQLALETAEIIAEFRQRNLTSRLAYAGLKVERVINVAHPRPCFERESTQVSL